MEKEIWSNVEKRRARKIFDEQLTEEYNFIIEKTRELAIKATSREDLWEIHSYLTNALKNINRKYDYRYSRIINLFGELLAEGRISERDLAVFSVDKVEQVRYIAKFIKRKDLEEKSKQE